MELRLDELVVAIRAELLGLDERPAVRARHLAALAGLLDLPRGAHGGAGEGLALLARAACANTRRAGGMRQDRLAQLAQCEMCTLKLEAHVGMAKAHGLPGGVSALLRGCTQSRL